MICVAYYVICELSFDVTYERSVEVTLSPRLTCQLYLACNDIITQNWRTYFRHHTCMYIVSWRCRKHMQVVSYSVIYTN